MFNREIDEEKLYRLLDYRFKNKNLLLQALTRQSAINEGKQSHALKSFQQLEFLGDKILDLVIGDVLLENYPNADEGQLTIQTAKYVNNQGPLAAVARQLKLNKFIIVGHGEEIHNDIRNNDKALSDAMEALLGALWLDSHRDYDFLKKFITKQWECVGLPQPVKLSDLDSIMVSYYHTPLPQRLNPLKACLKRPVSQEVINAFLAETAFEDEGELLHLVLSHEPSLSSINNAFINALIMGCDASIPILLEHGANANFIYPPERWDEWKDCGLDTNPYAKRTISALNIAVTSCSAKTIELLLESGADPNWNKGVTTRVAGFSFSTVTTAIHDTLDIALPDFLELSEQLAHTLFSDFSEKSSQSYTRKETFSLFAQNRKPKKIVKTNNQFTALHEIMNHWYQIGEVNEKIQLLIKWKANINAQDYEGNTPLHCIAHDANDFEIYDFLVELGAYQHIKNNQDETPQQIKQTYDFSSDSSDGFYI